MALSSMVLSTPIKSHILNTSQTTLDSSHDSSFNSSKLELSGYSTSPATTPIGRDNKAGWYTIHDQHKSLCARPHVECILCGDSIIAGLSRYPKVWRKYFTPLSALNCGIGGDRTQHVLWRAEKLNVSKSLKFVVIHCGTNNIDRDQPLCIANGILSVALTFREKAPKCDIIVTGLLPRDQHDTYRRDKIKKVNKILKRKCKGKDDLSKIHYMRQDDDWVGEDGKLDESLYHTDYLHLIEAGNDKFATSITNALEQVKEHGEMIYSEDDGQSDSADDEYPRKRRFTDFIEEKDDCHQRPRKRNRHSDEHRRHSSKRSKYHRHSSPPRRRDRSEERTRKRSSSGSSKSKWKVAREQGVSRLKEKKQPVENDETSFEKRSDRLNDDEVETKKVSASQTKAKGPLSGTAKSIDITLDEQKRREARRNKFAAPKGNPSALVRKITEVQQETRKNIEAQRKKKWNNGESGNTVPTTDPEKVKKFFSDYTADSDSE